MPELPEVEVTRKLLAPRILGRRIARAHTSAPSYFFLTPPRRLSRDLEGRTIESLERAGKYLLMGVGDGHRLLMHLGMTGQLFMEGSESPRLINQPRRARSNVAVPTRDPHLHLVLTFADGPPGLWFRDVRKFGKVRWLKPGQTDERLDKLGPDALSADGDALFGELAKRRVPVKTVLLDQGVLAGVGNIYADEALFHAGIRPGRAARRVTRAESAALAEQVRRVLARSIETGGSSISDFINPDGNDGHFQDERRVYARTGEPCLTCSTPIVRMLIGQRSSHYCPRCQR
jgi:formamidopyrimidine-DNA glycosylase